MIPHLIGLIIGRSIRFILEYEYLTSKSIRVSLITGSGYPWNWVDEVISLPETEDAGGRLDNK